MQFKINYAGCNESQVKVMSSRQRCEAAVYLTHNSLASLCVLPLVVKCVSSVITLLMHMYLKNHFTYSIPSKTFSVGYKKVIH